jgi:hypothetical protein
MNYPDHEQDITLNEEQRKLLRDNARNVLQQSKIASILQEMNRALLKGRGWFDEYDSGVIMKWGSGTTRRHIWIHIDGNLIRVRLREHRPCQPDTTSAICDGEYHTYSPQLWSDSELMKQELKSYYDHPVTESSED